MMEYAIILDYSTGEVYADEMDEEMNQKAEEGTDVFLDYYGFNPDECYVMWTNQFPHIKPIKDRLRYMVCLFGSIPNLRTNNKLILKYLINKMEFKLISKHELAELLRKSLILEYLKRIVDNDAPNRAYRLLVDDKDNTLLDEIKKDDDYFTLNYSTYYATFRDEE